MALIRFIYDFLRKEELMAFDYIRKHPRAKWLIGLDAILTVSIVFAGYSFASESSKSSTMKELISIGAVAMRPSEFVDHVRVQGGREFWLGEIPGFDIAADDSKDDMRTVSYVESGSDSHDLGRPKITVVTYRSSIDASGIHQFGTWSDPTSFVTSSGLIIEYDKSAMTEQKVSFYGTYNVVSIIYSKAQNLQTFINNAGALRLVS